MPEELGNLSLSRRTGQRVYIGDEVVITVLEIGFTKVRLCITCPKDVAIVREELLDQDDARRDLVRQAWKGE